MDAHRDEKTPAEHLDEFRGGAQQILVLAKMRLAELERALDGGDFSKAIRVHAELGHRLSVLAWCEANLSVWANSYVVRASDVQEGMNMPPHGVVVSVEREGLCGCGRDHGNLTVAFDDDTEISIHENDEVLMDREAESSQ